MFKSCSSGLNSLFSGGDIDGRRMPRLTIELKECRRRIACPYRRVLCPPLCAACRVHKNTHMHKKGVVTCQVQAPDRPVPVVSNYFNLHPTSGTECWPQDLRTNGDDLKLGAHISQGGWPPHLINEDMQSDLPQEMVFLAPVSMSE